MTGKLALSAALVLTLAACDDSTTSPRRAGQFRALDVHAQSFRVVADDPAQRRRAGDLLDSGEIWFVVGRPQRGSGYNSPWPWHLDPATVRFEQVTAEACQTDARGVSRELDYWLSYPLGVVCIDARIVERED
jgi:hypothetical protein